MAEPSYGSQEQRPLGDVRHWEPERRRVVSLGVLAASAVLVLGGILLFAVSPSTAGVFLWVVIVLLVLLLLFEAAVLATGIAREEGGPPWLTGLEPGQTAQAAGAGAGAGAAGQEQAYAGEADQEAQSAGPATGGDPYGAAAAEAVEIDLKCPDCQNLFTVEDTGERPLAIDCPHCGAHGHVDLPAPAAQEEGAPAAGPPTAAGRSIADEPLEGLDDEPDASAAPGGQEELPSISLKCPSCATQFDVEDNGERPLRTTCPGCGKSGKLRGRPACRRGAGPPGPRDVGCR